MWYIFTFNVVYFLLKQLNLVSLIIITHQCWLLLSNKGGRATHWWAILQTMPGVHATNTLGSIFRQGAHPALRLLWRQLHKNIAPIRTQYNLIKEGEIENRLIVNSQLSKGSKNKTNLFGGISYSSTETFAGDDGCSPPPLHTHFIWVRLDCFSFKVFPFLIPSSLLRSCFILVV